MTAFQRQKAKTGNHYIASRNNHFSFFFYNVLSLKAFTHTDQNCHKRLAVSNNTIWHFVDERVLLHETEDRPTRQHCMTMCNYKVMQVT